MKYTRVQTLCGLIIANMVLILEVPNPKWRLLLGKDKVYPISCLLPCIKKCGSILGNMKVKQIRFY